MKKKMFNINLIKKHIKNCSGPLTERDFRKSVLNNDSVDDFILSKTLPKLFSYHKNNDFKKNHSNSFISTISNSKIKEEMINLRDEINKNNFKLKVLKMAYSKLTKENNSIMKLLDDIISRSKTNVKLIKLNRSKSQNSEIKMTNSTYKQLKRIDHLSILRNKIIKIKTRINSINSEKKDLEKQSKIIKLKEKSNDLLEIINQYENLKLKNDNLLKKIKLAESENKNENKSLDYSRSINKLYNNENKNLENTLNLLNQEKMINKKNIEIKNVNENKLKYQYNTINNLLKELTYESNIHKNNINGISELKKNKENSKKIIEDNKTIINKLNEENKKLKDSFEQLNLNLQELKNKLHEKKNIYIKQESLFNKENEEIKNQIIFLKESIYEENMQLEYNLSLLQKEKGKNNKEVINIESKNELKKKLYSSNNLIQKNNNEIKQDDKTKNKLSSTYIDLNKK